MQQRLDRASDIVRIRRQTVEHPFGKLQAWMRATLPHQSARSGEHRNEATCARLQVQKGADDSDPPSAALHRAAVQISGTTKFDAPRAQMALGTKETAQQPDVRYRRRLWPGPIAGASLRPLRQERLQRIVLCLETRRRINRRLSDCQPPCWVTKPPKELQTSQRGFSLLATPEPTTHPETRDWRLDIVAPDRSSGRSD